MKTIHYPNKIRFHLVTITPMAPFTPKSTSKLRSALHFQGHHSGRVVGSQPPPPPEFWVNKSGGVEPPPDFEIIFLSLDHICYHVQVISRGEVGSIP